MANFKYRTKSGVLVSTGISADEFFALPAIDQKSAIQQYEDASRAAPQGAAYVLDNYSDKPDKRFGLLGIASIPGVGLSSSERERVRFESRAQEGLGRGQRKEELIATVLNKPEESINITSGIPSAYRIAAAGSAVKEEKDMYLELKTGGKVQKISIDGSLEDFIAYDDGRVQKVNEEGATFTDAATFGYQYSPELIGIGTETGLAFLGPKGFLAGLVVGPALEASLDESQNIAFRKLLNKELKKADIGEIDLATGSFKRFGLRAGTGFVANGILGLGPARVAVKKIGQSIVSTDSAKAASKAITNLKKEARKRGIDLSVIPEQPATAETFRITGQTAEGADQLQSINKVLSDLEDNLTGKLLKDRDAGLQRRVEDVAKTIDNDIKIIDANADSLGEEAVDFYKNSLAEQARKLFNVSKNGGPEINPKDFESIYMPLSDSVQSLLKGVGHISDKNYNKVSKFAKDNKSKILVSSFFNKMKSFLPESELNQLVALFSDQIKGLQAKTFTELASSTQFNRMTMDFNQFNALYLLRNSVDIEQAINRRKFINTFKSQRLNVLKPAGKKLLREADNYYSEFVDPVQNRIAGQLLDIVDVSGARKWNNAISLNNAENFLSNAGGGSVSNIKKTLEIFKDTIESLKGSSNLNEIALLNAARQGQKQFMDSLRETYLIREGAFTMHPSQAITNPSKGRGGQANENLQDLLFPSGLYRDMFSTIREISKIGVNPTVSGAQQVISVGTRLGQAEARKVSRQLINAARAKFDAERIAAQQLFKVADIAKIGNQTGLGQAALKDTVDDSTIRDFMFRLREQGEESVKKFRQSVLSALLAKNRSSDFVYDGDGVLNAINNNPDKFKEIFGEDLGFVKNFSSVVKTFPLVESLGAQQVTRNSNNIATTAGRTGVRFYLRLRSSLSDPMRETKILTSAMLGRSSTLGSMSTRAKEISPDFLFKEGILSAELGKVLASDQALTVLASNNDPILVSLLQDIFDEANANPDQK